MVPVPKKNKKNPKAKGQTSKSLGNDNICSYFLRLATLYIERAIVFMFNTSLVASRFPNSWKKARITALVRKTLIHPGQSGFLKLHSTLTC